MGHHPPKRYRFALFGGPKGAIRAMPPSPSAWDNRYMKSDETIASPGTRASREKFQ